MYKACQRRLKNGWRWVSLIAILSWALVYGVVLLTPQHLWAKFIEAPDAHLPNVNDTTYTFATGDVDGDGDTDVIVANAGQSRLLLGDGLGSFVDATATHLPAISLTSMTAVLGDVDGDLDTDLILGDVRGPNRLFRNDGTGHFSLAPEANLPAQSQISIGLALGDVDRDGDLDLVVANRRSQNRLWLNDGSGVFIDATVSHLPAEALDSYDVALGDVDGNGTLDLVVANHDAPDQLWLNQGQGVFRDVTDRRFSGATSDSFDVAWIDIESDGDLDVVIAAGKRPLRLWINNGRGIFADVTPARLPVLAGFGMRAEVGDVDDDGDDDLLLAAAGQDRILLNDGRGHFSEATEALLPNDRQRSFGLALFDADRDLDPDLMVGTPSGPNRFLLNELPRPRLRILVSSAPPHAVGEPIALTIQAADEDGLASANLTLTDPVGQAEQRPVLADLADGKGATTFTPTRPGNYDMAITVADRLGYLKTRQMRLTVQALGRAEPKVAVTIDSPAPIAVDQVIKQKVTKLLTFNPF